MCAAYLDPVPASPPGDRAPWIVRHFRAYLTLAPWAFTWRITLEGLLVSVAAVLLLAPFVETGDRFESLSLETIVVLLVAVAPVLETLLFQALPIGLVRLLRGGPAAQVIVSTALFAAAHFLEGFVVGVAAGLVGGFYFAFTYAHWRRRSRWTALWTTMVSHALHNTPPALLFLAVS